MAHDPLPVAHGQVHGAAKGGAPLRHAAHTPPAQAQVLEQVRRTDMRQRFAESQYAHNQLKQQLAVQACHQAQSKLMLLLHMDCQNISCSARQAALWQCHQQESTRQVGSRLL